MNEVQDGTFNWGWVIFIILILWFFVGGNGFMGGRAALAAEDSCCAHGNSNCQIAKEQIATTATTQFLIEQRTHDVQDSINANINAKYAADQAEKLFDCKINTLAQQNAFQLQLMEKNSTIERLQLMSNINDKFCQIGNQIQTIGCNMLKKPEITGIGAVCPNAGILNGLGINSNPFCGCNSSNIA